MNDKDIWVDAMKSTYDISVVEIYTFWRILVSCDPNVPMATYDIEILFYQMEYTFYDNGTLCLCLY